MVFKKESVMNMYHPQTGDKLADVEGEMQWIADHLRSPVRCDFNGDVITVNPTTKAVLPSSSTYHPKHRENMSVTRSNMRDIAEYLRKVIHCNFNGETITVKPSFI